MPDPILTSEQRLLWDLLAELDLAALPEGLRRDIRRWVDNAPTPNTARLPYLNARAALVKVNLTLAETPPPPDAAKPAP